MKPEDILEATRKRILEHAGDHPDKWFYANRYVYARLQLDERKTKTDVKRNLFESGASCHFCGKPFEAQAGVHIHRLDEERGYSDDNCALMHRECHQKHHAENPRKGRGRGRPRVTASMNGVTLIRRESKRYTDKAFLYWWDIAPPLVEELTQYDAVQFIKKDTEEICTIPTNILLRFLTEERQTSRGQGNWGLKVLKDRPDDLGLEPPKGGKEWLFLPVRWEGALSDD